MKVEKKKTDDSWRWSGWTVVSIDDRNEPKVTYPQRGMGIEFTKIDSIAVIVFNTRKAADEYRKGYCKEQYPFQKHRTVKIAVAMAAALTEKERNEIDAEVKG